jgi:Flp pilus assembly protein TadD
MNAPKSLCMLALLAGACAAADLGRGKQLYLEGKLSDAVTELEQAVQQSPDSAEANRLLGLALIEQDKVSEGERYIKRAMELDPGPASKIANARLLVAQKNYDQAEEMLRDNPGDGPEPRKERRSRKGS